MATSSFEEFLKRRQAFGKRIGETKTELRKLKYDTKAKKIEKEREKYTSKPAHIALINKSK